MFYYHLRKFFLWSLASLAFPVLALAATIFAQAFVDYRPLSLRLIPIVFALQIPDSLRFAGSLAAFCIAALAVRDRHIMLIRTTHGTARQFLMPFLLVCAAMTGFCMFFDNFVTPALKQKLSGEQHRALMNGVRGELSRTGSFRAGQIVMTASSIDGTSIAAPFCAVGTFLVRGESGSAGENGMEIRNADIFDIHTEKTFHAGTFQILLPVPAAPHSGPALWISRPWRAYRRMSLAAGIIPLTFIGLIAGLASGRFGSLRAFLLWLALVFALYLGIERGLIRAVRHSLPIHAGWVIYCWPALCAVGAWLVAGRMFRSRCALGLGPAT